jgi:hypothetical protein
VLVKEVFEATTGAMTTGNVSRANILKGWFVMMKDSKNSHPDNKLWGDGWGWSWFDAAAPSKTISTNYKVDCQSCHVPARASDWIYVQGYPALKTMIVTPASLRSCAANAVTFGPLPEARSRESAEFYFCTGPARYLLCGGRQELVVDQGLQRVAK